MLITMKQKVHDRIKELRSALGLSQTEFAYQTGISHSLLTKVESGDNPPTNKVIGKIVSKWGVTEAWLLSGKGELTYNKDGDSKDESWKGEAWTLAKEELKEKGDLLRSLAVSFDRVTKMLQDSGGFLRPVAKTGTD